MPPKTCTLDCLYCEVGRTSRRVTVPEDFGLTEAILSELAKYLGGGPGELDYVTLAGSGEPTLNAGIDKIIAGVKALTRTPVAVLTNGTLLWRPEVRRKLLGADLAIPSLDTAVEETFRRLNQPAPDLKLDAVIEGLYAFREEFPGRFWLEVLLVQGYNDSSGELEALRAVIERLRPDRVQVNTVFRPPAYSTARPLTAEALAAATRLLGREAETVGRFRKRASDHPARNLEADVLALLERRPCPAADMAESLGIPVEEVRAALFRLETEGRVRRERHLEDDYFRAGPS